MTPTASAQPFSTDTWAATAQIRDAIDTLPFLRLLEDGTLPRETFTHYLAQDARYLLDYGRALAACAALSVDPDHVTFWATAATHAIAGERQLHADHVDVLSTVEASPTCTAYTSWMLALAGTGDVEQLAAAVLPCFWVYQDVGSRLVARVGDLTDHPYGDWIATYGDPDFADRTTTAVRIVDELAERAGPATRDAMHVAFRRGVQYEWMFWDAAHRHEQWPV